MNTTITDIISHNARQVDLACAEVTKTEEHMHFTRQYNEYHHQIKDTLPEDLRDALAEMEVTNEQAAELCYHACYLAGVADGFAMRREIVS